VEESKYFYKFQLSGIGIGLKNDQVTYLDILTSDVFVYSLPMVGLKVFGLSLEKSLILKLSDVRLFFCSITVFPC
jgi:hypothetical protein